MVTGIRSAVPFVASLSLAAAATTGCVKKNENTTGPVVNQAATAAPTPAPTGTFPQGTVAPFVTPGGSVGVIPTAQPGSGTCAAGGGSTGKTWAAESGFANSSDLKVPSDRPKCSAQTVQAFVEQRLPDKLNQWDFLLRDPGLAPRPASAFESLVPIIERCFNEYLATAMFDLAGTTLSIRHTGNSIESCFKAGVGAQQISYEINGRYSLDFACNGQSMQAYAGKSVIDPAFARDFCKDGSSGKMRFTGYVMVAQPSGSAGGAPVRLYRRMVAIGDKDGNACSFTAQAGGKRSHENCVTIDKIEREDGLAWLARAQVGTAKVSYGANGMVLSEGKAQLNVGSHEGDAVFPALAGSAGAPATYSLSPSFGSGLGAAAGTMPQR